MTAQKSSMKKSFHPIFSDKLINDFNIQDYAGHYFIIGRSKNNTTTQKAVVMEQQKRKLNIAGETKRRTQSKEDDDDSLDDNDIEIDGGVITVKIEPIAGESIEVFKKFFSIDKGEVVKKNWVHKEGDKSIAKFTEGSKSYELQIPDLVNEFTLSGVPLVSRVYFYQKTDIDLSKGIIETKIKWLEKIRDVCANKVFCYSKFFPHIHFCNEITLLNYEKNGNTNKRAADDIFLQKKTLPHNEFCEYIDSLTTQDESKQKKRTTQKVNESQGEPKSKFQKVLVQNVSNDSKETFFLNTKITVEKEEPEPELENKNQTKETNIEELDNEIDDDDHLELINDESGDEDLLD